MKHDFDRDGFSDVVLLPYYSRYDKHTPNDERRVLVYKGSPQGPAPEPTVLSTSVPGECTRDDCPIAGVGSASGDFDGDGSLDLAVHVVRDWFSDPGSVLVFRGMPRGLPSAAEIVLRPAAGQGAECGAAMASGDVDGDGVTDLVVGCPGLEHNRGAVFLYRGSRDGWKTATALRSSLGAQGRPAYLGFPVAAADVDRDGFADVFAGGDKANCVYGFRGSPTGLSALPAWTVCSPDGNRTYEFPNSLALGDVTADRTPDLLVQVGFFQAGGAELDGVALYAGSGGGVPGTPTARYSRSREGYEDVLVEDVNGDGTGDLIVGRATHGREADGGATGDLLVFHGGSPAPAIEPSTRLTRSLRRYHRPCSNILGTFGFARSIAAVGDVNGDGRGDIAVGCPGRHSTFVFGGSPDGLQSTELVELRVYGHMLGR